MHTLFQDQAIHVISIELRTTNRDAAHTIPPHWQRFRAEGITSRIPALIPARTDDAVLAVYTHFRDARRSNEGLYSLILGAGTGGRLPRQSMLR